MKITYTGPESGANAKYTWDSKNKNLGNGYLEITECVPNEYIIMNMSFMDEGISTCKFLFTKDTTGVRLLWSMESKIGKNPITKYFGLLMDKMVGSDFEKGLKNIKKIVEDEYAEILKYPVEEKNIEKFCALTTRVQCSEKDISSNMGVGYAELMKLMLEKKLKQVGAPFAVYLAFDKISGVDMELGLPVSRCIKLTKGKVGCTDFEASKVACVNYYGPYDGASKAHEVLNKWIKKNNKLITGPPREIYHTDPGMEKDTSKWLTLIMYPIK
jgi:effector-binding domain-containing protein